MEIFDIWTIALMLLIGCWIAALGYFIDKKQNMQYANSKTYSNQKYPLIKNNKMKITVPKKQKIKINKTELENYAEEYAEKFYKDFEKNWEKYYDDAINNAETDRMKNLTMMWFLTEYTNKKIPN